MRGSRYNIWVDKADASYIYNGVSGALLKIQADQVPPVRAFLAGASIEACSPHVLEKMAIGRMLVNDDTDEIGILQSRYEATRKSRSQFALTLVTSLGCNFDCPYCFEDKHASTMGNTVQKAVLGLVAEKLESCETFHVSWYGGEPLIGKPAILALSDRFIEMADKAGVPFSAQLISNGYLLDEPTCRELAERRVSQVQVCVDGPPEVHDVMRPLVGGHGTFGKIVRNLRHAVEYFAVALRVNVSAQNAPFAEKLLQALHGQGLSGKIVVYPGQIIGVDDGAPAPSTRYKAACFTLPAFSQYELEFQRLASSYGFHSPSVPSPSGAPCTAVRANELVVGSVGELYKCVESVGNPKETVGSIFDWRNPNVRWRKWLEYDPFGDPDCRGCVALPVCMGGCAHHGMDDLLYESRCDSFRFNHRERVERFISAAEQSGGKEMRTVNQLALRLDTR